MKTTALTAVLIMTIGTASCLAAEKGTATITGTTPESHVSGIVALTETPEGLRLLVDVAHVPPGAHGFHIHEFGACGDAGKAAGGHYNPAGVQHGYLPEDGLAAAHAGDFGNL